MATILIVDDEISVRNSLKEILEFEKYMVMEAENGLEAIKIIKDNEIDLVICDIKMPKMDGIEVLEQSMKIAPETKFIMISGHGDVNTAIDCVKKGAFDFINKPPDLNKLLITITNALEHKNLVEETKELKSKIKVKTYDIVGESESITKIKNTIMKVAPTDARVLITGENGVGKELVARWIHNNSLRSSRPFIEVNCAAIPNELIESELFGHEKGSFTSAFRQRVGKFEQANGGTLFLDEIGDMDLSAQAKVLRALQENKITRVGGEKDINVDVRIVAATNKKIDQLIKDGSFRIDLYHRLSVILLHVPTLNERKTDIPLIVDLFCKEICNEYNMPIKQVTPRAMEQLMEYEWTGNVRELRNVIERLVIMSGNQITDEDLKTYVFNTKAAVGNNLDDIFDQFNKFQDFKDFIERKFINHKLTKNSWNVSKTSDELDIQRSHLYNKIEKFNLKRD